MNNIKASFHACFQQIVYLLSKETLRGWLGLDLLILNYVRADEIALQDDLAQQEVRIALYLRSVA